MAPSYHRDHKPGRAGLVFPEHLLNEPGVVCQPGWPLLATPVPAGFPSPASDYIECRLSLDEHLIEHPEATFFVRVQGDSMTGMGIHDGDLLVVDRACTPKEHSVVIAVVDGQFMVKQLHRVPEGILLRSKGAGHSDILVSGDQELTIWGVVRWTLHAVAH